MRMQEAVCPRSREVVQPCRPKAVAAHFGMCFGVRAWVGADQKAVCQRRAVNDADTTPMCEIYQRGRRLLDTD